MFMQNNYADRLSKVYAELLCNVYADRLSKVYAECLCNIRMFLVQKNEWRGDLH